MLTEESEAASKQVLAKSEQIRKFQEENKYLGQLVSSSLGRFSTCFPKFYSSSRPSNLDILFIKYILETRRLCSHLVPKYDSRWDPRQNSGTVPVPEYQVKYLYSGTGNMTISWIPSVWTQHHFVLVPRY